MYIKSTYDGLHVITGTTENVSACSLNVNGIGCLSKFDTESPCFSFKCMHAVLLSLVRVRVPVLFISVARTLLVTSCCQFII